MNLEALKAKATAAKEFDESQRKGREKTETQADTKRGEFARQNQQEQVTGALEQLKQSKKNLEAFKQRLEGFVAQATELRGKKGGSQKQLGEIYGKINEMLADQDIQKELAGMGKNIVAAEQLVGDADFADQPGVSEALDLQNTIGEIENQLVALEQDERKLHSEIQGSGSTETGDLSQIRQETVRALEEQSRQLEEEIGVLELHTPEGQKKAETELKRSLESKGEVRSVIDTKDKLASGALSENLVRPEMLKYKDILGEEKFKTEVQDAYGKKAEQYGEAYKKRTGLDTWERDFKKVEGYGERLKETEATIKKLEGTKAEVVKDLATFLTSPEGRPLFEKILRSYQKSAETETEARREDADERIKERVDSEIRYSETHPDRAEELVKWAVTNRLESLATAFVADKQGERARYGIREPDPAISSNFYVGYEAGQNLHNNSYENLPDLDATQEALGKLEAFYRKIAEKAKDPEALDAILQVASASEKFLNEHSYRGLKTNFSQPETTGSNPLLYGLGKDFQDGQRMKKEFADLMPDLKSTKVGTVKFETPNFNVQTRSYNFDVPLRETKRQELADLTKFVVGLKSAMWEKADYDITRAEIAEFEQSTKFPEVKAHGDVQKRQETIKAILPEIIALQQKVEGKRQIGMQENSYDREITVGLRDTESENLYKKQEQLSDEVKKKTQELQNLEYQGRPGMLSGKRGAWDNATAKLRAEIPQLQSDLEKTKDAITNLRPVRDGLAELGKILARVAKEMPEDYRKLNLKEASTAGQIYEKVNQLTQEVTGLQTTGDQREFSRDYKRLQSKAGEIKANVERVAATLGVRNLYF